MSVSPEVKELVIITGASTGIGAAAARELARRGFHVLAGVRRDRDAQVVVVEPGAVRTEMAGRAIATAHEVASTMTPEQSQRYGGLVQAITAQTAAFTDSGLPADAAARVIAKAVTARKPRTRYTVGRDAALLTRLARILPDRILDLLFAAALRPYFSRRVPAGAIRGDA